MASHPIERAADSIDIDAVRARLNAYKQASGDSWTVLARKTGIAHGTLSTFGTNNYAGDNQRIALQIDNWFEAETRAEELRQSAPIEAPAYLETRAARELTNLFRWARRGRMVAAATCPGFGKTSALQQFAVNTPNTWLVTMFPSTSGVQTMLAAILKAMGEKETRGSPQMLSDRIKERVQGTTGLICIDEAQHLSVKAMDELRGIHDVTGIGIALVGNAALLELLEGGTRQVSHAQLYSRISMRIAKVKGYPEDGVALARAWGIQDEPLLDWIGQLALTGGALRTVSMVIELASVLASVEAQPISHAHLKDAWAQLSLRPVN